MTAELSEARLKDEGIEYQVMNKSDLGYTMEVGNASMARQALAMPIKFFVMPEDAERAALILNEDKSALMDDPNAEFESSDTYP